MFMNSVKKNSVLQVPEIFLPKSASFCLSTFSAILRIGVKLNSQILFPSIIPTFCSMMNETEFYQGSLMTCQPSTDQTRLV